MPRVQNVGRKVQGCKMWGVKYKGAKCGLTICIILQRLGFIISLPRLKMRLTEAQDAGIDNTHD